MKIAESRALMALALAAIVTLPVVFLAAPGNVTAEAVPSSVVNRDPNDLQNSPEVQWRDVNTQTLLYFTREVHESEAENTRRMTTFPADPDTNTPDPIQYSVTGSGGSALNPALPPVARFRSGLIHHPFNITGDDAIHVTWYGNWQTDVHWYVRVYAVGAGRELIGQTDFDDPNVLDPLAPESTYKVSHAVPLERGHDTRYSVDKNTYLEVEIEARRASTGSDLLPSSVWKLNVREAARPSRLEITSEDAIKVAGWATNHQSIVRDLFRHNATLERINLINATFSVRSAFGDDDVRCTRAEGYVNPDDCDHETSEMYRPFTPKVRFYKNGQPHVINLGGSNSSNFDLKVDETNSSAPDGMWVFRMAKSWDFTNDTAGEYEARFEGTLRPDDTALSGGANAPGQSTRLDAVFPFIISDQSLVIRAYDDVDPGTVAPLETLSHEVKAGGSTTFLFVLENLGTSNDTVEVRAEQNAATPPTGWVVTVGGPRTTGDGKVRVGPGESVLVTTTVQAPVSGVNGNTAVFTLTAHSSIEAGVKSDPQSFTATVSDRVRNAVGLVNLTDTLEVAGAKATKVQFYAWNRGTRAENLSVTLKDETTEGWDLSLLNANGQRVESLVFNTVPAGAIVQANLQVLPQAGRPAGDLHRTRVNVTYVEAGGPGAEHEIEFVVKADLKFKLETLDAVSGIADHIHYLEMACLTYIPATCRNEAAPTGTDTNDSVNGTWFRVWITNEGSVPDRYGFELVNDPPRLGEGGVPIDDPRDDAFPTVVGPDFNVWYRKPDGRLESPHGDGLPLLPGQTGEVYVWLGHQEDSGRYAPTDYAFTLFVRSKTDRNLEDSKTFYARGNDNLDGLSTSGEGRRNGLKVEAVTRLKPYVEPEGKMVPIINKTNVMSNVVNGLVEIGANVTYRARVTNAASWSSYGDTSANLSLTLLNAGALAAGWEVKMRPVNGTFDDFKNPWVDSLVISNYNEHERRHESFYDREVEIRVVPPLANSSFAPNADDKVDFVLQGQVGDKTDSLTFRTTITKFANVSLDAVSLLEPVHPGETTAFILNIRNNGSSTANVKLSTRVDETSTQADLWTVFPQEETFQITRDENLSKVIRVTAPTGLTDGEAHVNVTLTYEPNPTDPFNVVNRTVDLTTVVRQPAALQLTPAEAVTSAAPEKSAVFTFELTNTDETRTIPYTVSTTPIPDWIPSIAPRSGELGPGDSETLTYTLLLPDDVIRGRTYWSTLKVQESGADAAEGNFDVASVQVNIIEGAPIPSLQPEKREDIIGPDGTIVFPIAVKNLGNAPGTFPVETRAGDGTGFETYVTDVDGNRITTVEVGPNERKTVHLRVKAPADLGGLSSNAPILATLTAFSSPTDSSVRADVTVKVFIHEQAVDVEVNPKRTDVIPGQATEFTVKVTNLGNGRDNISLTTDFIRMDGWRSEYSVDKVVLEPGASTTLRLILRTPRDDLPSARSYTFQAVAESEAAKAAGLVKRDTEDLTVTVPSYRPFDVDGDGRLELAVDANRRSGDGYERFVEIFSDGAETLFVDNFSGKGDGRFDHLLEVPQDGVYTGIANLYYDPDLLFVHTIKPEHAVDLTGDATPDYLLDTDDDGVIDSAWDTAARRLMRVSTIQVFGSATSQFLVDVDRDGRPDKYYDPEGGVVTSVTHESRYGPNSYAIDTQNDGVPDKYYNQQTGEITNAPVGNVKDFLEGYWYFFALFAAVVILAVLVVTKRRGKPAEAPAPAEEEEES